MHWTLPPVIGLSADDTRYVLARFVENSRDNARQRGTLVTSTVMTGLALIFVVLRVISRFWIMRNPGMDDVLLILSTVVLCGFLASLAVSVHNHAGYPSVTLDAGNIEALSKTALLVEILYYFNICFIKCSILLTYLRFAVTRIFRRLCKGTIYFHVFLCIGSVVAVFSQTDPLSKMWTAAGDLNDYRINLAVLFYVTAGINIATDFWILVLPIKALSQIRRPRGEKIVLFCVFGAGLFASVASIVRLRSIAIYVNAEDHLRNSLSLLLWCMIEMSVAICCASVTGMRPIWLWIIRRQSRKDLTPNAHKKSQANMNSFFQNKRKESDVPADLEAQMQEAPPDHLLGDETRDELNTCPGTTDTTLTQSSQPSHNTKVLSNADRGDLCVDEAIAMGSTVGSSASRQAKQFQQELGPTVVRPPRAVTKYTARTETTSPPDLSRRVSELDYHKFI